MHNTLFEPPVYKLSNGSIIISKCKSDPETVLENWNQHPISNDDVNPQQRELSFMQETFHRDRIAGDSGQIPCVMCKYWLIYHLLCLSMEGT